MPFTNLILLPDSREFYRVIPNDVRDLIGCRYFIKSLPLVEMTYRSQ